MPDQPAILLIEDETNLRHNLTILLEGEGYHVVSAEDGAEGICKLEQETFDLVITDVVMPKVDGFQVMEYLKSHMPDVVVVAITAYVSTESAIEALRRGAYDYLAKPFDVDLMQAVIKRAVEKARMQKAFRHYMGELEQRLADRTRHLAEANGHIERSMEELRTTQAQLAQAERFQALGEVTTAVAHDLGNSLAMIVGFAQVLAKIAPTESRMKGQLEQIGEVAFRCHEIVKNLISFPWKQAPQKGQTSLNDICEQMLAALAYQADLSQIVVERRLDSSLPPVLADPHQLLQAFISIALNACRSITSARGGGSLTVETKWGDGTLQVAMHVEGLGVVTGRFERGLDTFLTIRDSAANLGLSLAYEIIKEHAGKMAVHSVPGEGTTYLIDFPLQEALLAAVDSPAGTFEVVASRRVLVVDADDKNLALVQEILRHLGHEADGCSSAHQALQNLADRRYDVIIAEMHSSSMGGSHFYHRLRLLQPGLAQRLIFISSGLLSEEDSVFLERVGCPLISKPFSVADIDRSIQLVLTR